MTLRLKTLLIVGLTLIGLVGVLYAASSRVLLSSLAVAEEQETAKVVRGATSVLNLAIRQFNDRFADWSDWDDSYTFVQDGNAEFV